MSVARIPTLVWELPNGWFTAVTVDDFASAAVAESEGEALSLVKAYLAWRYLEDELSTVWSDMEDIECEMVRVAIRPEHRVVQETREGQRTQVFPGSRPFSLDIAAVCGRLGSGVWLCSLPQVKEVFYFYERASLKDLVLHTVQESFKGAPPHAVYQAWTAVPPRLDEIVLQTRPLLPSLTPVRLKTVEKVAEPVADLRRMLARAFEREDVVAEVVQRLTRERASLVLVGEAGCGKTAVLVDAVRHIERHAEEDGPRRRFWMTRGARLISGMRYLGQWQERCEEIISELSDAGAVLCLESLLELVSVGGSPTDSVGAFLIPYLLRGELRLVAESTPTELEAVRRLLPGLADALQVVRVLPMDEGKTLRALESVTEGLTQKHRVIIHSRVREQVVALMRRFMPYRPLPGAASQFLRKLVDGSRSAGGPPAHGTGEPPALRGTMEVGTEVVLERFVRDTGLSPRLVRDDVPLSLADVVAALRDRVMGQTQACEDAAHVVVRFKAGVNDPRRPLGVLFFAGPTGVGKTELARALADYLFGHGEREDRLVRLDMSEYSTWGSEQRLLVDAKGEPSAFIRKMREQPFAVVLLDEIEKATPAVFDILLSMLDEGRLTDPLGRLTTFCSAVVIMTSNVGQESAAPIGLTSHAPDLAATVVARYFRPEFFNRLDAVVGFRPLSADVMRDIVDKELRALRVREGFVARSLTLSFSSSLVEHLAVAGFDARYGARPLQRLIEMVVVVPTAQYLVERPHVRGGGLELSWDGALRLSWGKEPGPGT